MATSVSAVYSALSNLRPRMVHYDDAHWYRYTFSGSRFASEVLDFGCRNFDPRHRPAEVCREIDWSPTGLASICGHT